MRRALAALVALLLLPGCSGLMLLPDRELVLNPGTVGMGYRDVRIPTTDGLSLHGWFLPAETEGEPAATVLFLHGNAENISNHLASVYWLPERGFNVLIFDYRGYGRSEGEADLDGAVADVQSALGYLAETREDEPLVVLGQSLGGALAPYAVSRSAYRERVSAVVLDSTFASFRAVAREKLAGFWLTWPFQWPLSWTISDRYEPARYVPALHPIPVLVVHNEGDRIIPVHHGRALYRAAREPKALWILPGGRHVYTFRRPGARDRLVDYLWERVQAPGQERPRPPEGPQFRLDTL